MAVSIRSLPLNALRSFDAAARHLNFGRAAEELGVTAAAVSAQIRRLEEWVGRPLFVRGHRSLTLSPAGERLAPRLTSLFVDMEHLLTDTVAIDVKMLRISTIQSFASKWLAPRIGRFMAQHPTLQLRISGEDRRVDLDRDGVDVALRYGEGGWDDVYSERLLSCTAFPVCHPALALRFPEPELIPAGLLIVDEASLIAPGLPTWEAWFGANGLPVPRGCGGVVFRNSHVAIAAAIEEQGFAFGLSPLVEADLAAGRLVRPYPLALQSPFGFWFVCRPDRLNEPKIAALRAWLVAEAALHR